jgi:hypothetical protein
MAESTGGCAYFTTSAREFHSVDAEIAQLVRHEYSLAFAPPARDGFVHSIEVHVVAGQKLAANVAGSPYHVDHRQAYLAPPPWACHQHTSHVLLSMHSVIEKLSGAP